MVYSRARSQRSGCPVCAGKVKEAQQVRYARLLEKPQKIASAVIGAVKQ